MYLGPRGWMGQSWWDYGLDNAYCNRCHERIWFTAGGERLTPDSQLAADRSDPPDGR